MAKKVFRPFWSYDIKKTENWLQTMALHGYRLKKVNTINRVFTFEKDSSTREVRYHIEYAKKHSDTIPATLKNDGWDRLLQAQNWYVLTNEQPPEKRRAFPVRDGVIRRNRRMMYLFSGMFIYTFLTSLLFIIMCSLMMFLGYSITIQVNAFWIVALIIGLVLWALAPYSTIKLYKTNHKFW